MPEPEKEIVKKTKYMVEFSDGSVEFTDAGWKELGPIFEGVGVNIEDVKTKAEVDRLVDESVADSLDDLSDDK